MGKASKIAKKNNKTGSVYINITLSHVDVQKQQVQAGSPRMRFPFA
jgi:hypothetical protein